MRVFLLLVAILCAACGSTPTAPTPTPPAIVTPPVTPPPPTPTSYIVGGTVTATNGGQALGGLNVILNGLPTTTNGAGGFSYSLTSGFTSQLGLTGPGIVPRALTLNIGSARTVAVNAISLTGGFDLNFYRQLVRNGFEAPATFEPLRRWTRTPQIYLKTVDEAGEAIHGPTLDLIEAVAKDAIPRWTSGVLGEPIVSRGTETRVGVSGWITIRFPATDTGLNHICGTAQVGVDGGWIELNYHGTGAAATNCRGVGAVVAPHTVRHELGHALGFWHTDTVADIMFGGVWNDTNQQPSGRELAAAAIAYARPVGNLDPDNDPTTTVSLAPRTVR